MTLYYTHIMLSTSSFASTVKRCLNQIIQTKENTFTCSKRERAIIPRGSNALNVSSKVGGTLSCILQAWSTFKACLVHSVNSCRMNYLGMIY